VGPEKSAAEVLPDYQISKKKAGPNWFRQQPKFFSNLAENC
jgi:hypothetical protein